MRASRLLAVSVLVLFVVAALPAHQTFASGNYSESLNVDIAGSSAYWYFTFRGINGTAQLDSFEASPGLSWYNITAIMTTGWQTDFQIFGPQGYNLLPVPYIPSQGLFLSLGANSYANASAAAGRLDPYLLCTFVSYSNSSGAYEFYSPLSFENVIPSTLLKLLPSSAGGFANAVTATALDSTPSPLVILEGNQTGSGFSHTLVVGSISSSALNGNDQPTVLSYFGSNLTSLSASNDSVSSTIHIEALDGIVASKDNATVTSNTAQFTGSYMLSLARNETIHQINATILQQPPELLAEQVIDTGVLKTGENMTVTLVLSDTSAGEALDNVTYSDDWWSPSQFKLVAGNASGVIPLLNESSTETPGYRLEYIGNTSGSVTMPAAAVHFTYSIGTSDFEGSAWLNPIKVSLGVDEPVIVAFVAPVSDSNQSVGEPETLRITATNVGTKIAYPVAIDGTSVGSLLADGGSYNLTVSQTASGLLGTNITRAYAVTYENADGETVNATTNVLPVIFSHSSMVIPFPTAVVSEHLAPLSVGSSATNLTLMFTVTNDGSAALANLTGVLELPQGLDCGIVNGTGLACEGGVLTLNYTSISSDTTDHSAMKVNVTVPENFIIPPFSFHWESGGLTYDGESNAVAAPTGYVLTKSFDPGLLFDGVSSVVTITGSNAGPFTIYNATVDSNADPFDSLSPLAVPSITTGSIAPGSNATKTYVVNATDYYGNHTASVVASTLYFGGTEFSLQGLGPYVAVYQPLSVTLTTSPASPTEGKSFALNFSITNPTSINVSSVLFTARVPSGLTLSSVTNGKVSGGEITISNLSLAAHSSYVVTADAVAASGQTYSFTDANLTFVYQGSAIRGFTPSEQVTVGVDVTTRYVIPLGIAVVILLAGAFYIRRLVSPNVPSAQK